MLSLTRFVLNGVHSSTFFSYSRLKKLHSLDISLLHDPARHTLQQYIHPKS